LEQSKVNISEMERVWKIFTSFQLFLPFLKNNRKTVGFQAATMLKGTLSFPMVFS